MPETNQPAIAGNTAETMTRSNALGGAVTQFENE